MEKEIVEFLIKAKRLTYAGKGAETTSSREKSHNQIYRPLTEYSYLRVERRKILILRRFLVFGTSNR